jgi:hypothetical protein
MTLILQFSTILSSTDQRRGHSLGPASCILHHQTGEALVLGKTPCRQKGYQRLSILIHKPGNGVSCDRKPFKVGE